MEDAHVVESITIALWNAIHKVLVTVATPIFLPLLMGANLAVIVSANLKLPVAQSLDRYLQDKHGLLADEHIKRWSFDNIRYYNQQ